MLSVVRTSGKDLNQSVVQCFVTQGGGLSYHLKANVSWKRREKPSVSPPLLLAILPLQVLKPERGRCLRPEGKALPHPVGMS